MNKKHQLVVTYGDTTTTLDAPSINPQIIVDVATTHGIELPWVETLVTTAREYNPAGWSDESLSIIIGKLALATLRWKHGDEAWEMIKHCIGDNEEQTATLLKGYWLSPRLTREGMVLLSAIVSPKTDFMMSNNDHRAILTFVKFIAGGEVGNAIGTLLSETYRGYIRDTISVTDAASEFATNSKLSDIIFSTLDLNAYLSGTYRKIVDGHRNSTRAVAVTYGQVIVADNLEEAKEKLDAALKEFVTGLQQQLEDKWGK